MVKRLQGPTKEQFLALVGELLSDKGTDATRREGEAIAQSLAQEDGAVVARVSRLLQILHPPKRKGSERTAPGRDAIKQRTIDRYYGPIFEILDETGEGLNDYETRKREIRDLVDKKLRERGIEIERRDVNSTLTTLAAFGPVLQAKEVILRERGWFDYKTGEGLKWLKAEIHKRCPELKERTIAQVLATEVGDDDDPYDLHNRR
jgi:hypothetical protein